MKAQVREIVQSFESGAITCDIAVDKLHKVTGHKVDPAWLCNYWSSESEEDFIDRLCADEIASSDVIDDSDALTLIAEYQQTSSAGRRDSIEAALERRYGKPTGMLRELVFIQGVSEPIKILVELKKDTRIYL